LADVGLSPKQFLAEFVETLNFAAGLCASSAWPAMARRNGLPDGVTKHAL